eukprot:2565706-Pleurochrysis_carterae.AAC.1
MDPSLSIAVSASRCAFELDLGGAAPSLRAECTLAVQTLGHGEAPLQLAECIATVELSPQRRVRRQWVDKPRLCDCVVFEESMLAVAATLANYSAIEGAAAGGGGDGGGGGGVSGGASGSGGSCAERRRDELLTPATHNDAPDPCQSLEERKLSQAMHLLEGEACSPGCSAHGDAVQLLIFAPRSKSEAGKAAVVRWDANVHYDKTVPESGVKLFPTKWNKSVAGARRFDRYGLNSTFHSPLTSFENVISICGAQQCYPHPSAILINQMGDDLYANLCDV